MPSALTSTRPPATSASAATVPMSRESFSICQDTTRGPAQPRNRLTSRKSAVSLGAVKNSTVRNQFGSEHLHAKAFAYLRDIGRQARRTTPNLGDDLPSVVFL